MYDTYNLKTLIDNIISIQWSTPTDIECKYCEILGKKLNINITNILFGMTKKINNLRDGFYPKYTIDKKPSLLFIQYEGEFKYQSPYIVYADESIILFKLPNNMEQFYKKLNIVGPVVGFKLIKMKNELKKSINDIIPDIHIDNLFNLCNSKPTDMKLIYLILSF